MNLAIQECSWDEVRTEVYNANAELAKMIDEFNPGKEYGFIKAKYPFGTNILENGKINLPTDNGKVIPLDHELVPPKLVQQLTYSTMPIGLVINNATEVYFETEERVMSSKILHKGSFFGLWELFDIANKKKPSIWSLSSGARSLFMLPRISDERFHAKLRKDFGLFEYAPKDMLFHTNVFKEIATAYQKLHDYEWTCDILFFGKKWTECDTNNLSQLKLRSHWYQIAWDQSLNCRNQMDYYSVAWEMFSKEVSRKHWKAKPYIINTIKHLIAITEGGFPGLAPALDDSCAPVSIIQNAYINSYSLKDYAPVIMQPSHIKSVDKYVYYSLTLPTLLERAPREIITTTILGDLKDLKRLMELFINTTKNDFNFDYFHCEKDRLHEIRHSSEIVLEDPDMKRPSTYKKNKVFCENSPFFKGCIRISKGENWVKVW